MDLNEFYKTKIIFALGGGTLMGLGIGFFFIFISIILFVGCLLSGIGLGLLVASIISSQNDKYEKR